MSAPASFVALLLAAAASVGDFETHADVGKVNHPGSAQYDAARREYRITGAGDNVWGKQDAFHFLHRKVDGDAAIEFNVAFLGAGKNAHRKACGMFRQDLSPGAAYADVAVHGDGLISLQYRKENGGTTQEVQSKVRGPARVRLERKADQFTLTVTPEGQAPATVGPVTVPLDGPVYVGLAVCSHEADLTETAVFSDVKLTTR